MFDPWVGKIPWRKAWQTTPVFLPGESHGHRSLAKYNSQSHKESDMTEATEHVCTHTHTHTSILIIIYSDFSPVLQLNLLQKKIVRYFHILFLSLPTKKISLLPLNFLGLMQSEYQKKPEQSSRQLSQLDCFKLEMTKSCQRKLRKKKKKTKKRRASKIRINPG